MCESCWKSHKLSVSIVGTLQFCENKTFWIITHCTLCIVHLYYYILITVWRYVATPTKAPYNHCAYYKKRSIRIVNNVGYPDHTTNPFLKTLALKFRDLVQF